ncbi:hypothetical protein KEM48_012059 [Puccinia striiformis f. sp. tritici PST-130]|nr:hypothetical protein Pst134EB_022297 [Puccinia striiformis f. sp. tritici]KAI9627730.1 hypothetical protein KEM48_012059 [Puccinia striiformis f. sp. tritici PST-130]
MQVIYLASMVLINFINAQTLSRQPAVTSSASGAKAASPGGKQPKLITMNCTRAYMPFSEADVAVLASKDTKAASSGNYSTIPTEVACKGPAGTVDGLCDISSCGNHPVCNNCVEFTITGPNTTRFGTTTISQVTCTNNYFFSNSTDPRKNVCTDGNKKTYTCSGGCTSYTSCQMCVSVDDPALQSVGP